MSWIKRFIASAFGATVIWVLVTLYTYGEIGILALLISFFGLYSITGEE